MMDSYSIASIPINQNIIVNNNNNNKAYSNYQLIKALITIIMEMITN